MKRENREYTLENRKNFKYETKKQELNNATTIKDSIKLIPSMNQKRKDGFIKCMNKTIFEEKDELRGDYERNKSSMAYSAEVCLRMVKVYRL